MTSSASETLGSPPAALAGGSRSFYASLGLGMAFFAFLAFVPTYWLPVVVGSGSATALVHVHGALFFGWISLFAVQAGLISRGRTCTHRRIGVLLGVWSAAAVVVGFRLAFVTIARDLALIDGTVAGVITLIALTQIVMFGAFLALGFGNLKRPEIHRRFMILAALVAVTPAIARLPIAAIGIDSPLVAPITFTLSTGLLLAVVWLDTRRSGRLHPVFAWGALIVILVRVARIPFAMSGTWRSAAETIAGWAG